MVSAFDVKFRNSFPIAIFSSSFIVSHFTSYSFIFLELILLHEVKGSNLVSPQMVSRFFSTPLSISNATFIQFSSFQLLSCVWLLQPHGRQHARLPCPSPTPGACSNSRPLSRWCHPNISSSVVPFSCLQSFPTSWSFLMSLLFASGGQVLGFQLQRQSLKWIFRTDFL